MIGSRRSTGLGCLVVALLFSLAAAPAALAVTNDNWQSPFNAAVNSFPVTLSAALNAEATVQQDEPITSLGPGTCNNRKMIGTTWYRILGNGGVVSVNTSGSNYDTVIAAYIAPTPLLNDGLPCNDDAGGTQSAISFQSTAGAAYLIQVGGCSGCGTASTGSLVMNLTATDPPAPPPPPPPPPPAPPPPPPPVVIAPPDVDGDTVPDNGPDKCVGVKPTRDENHDGCQDKPKRTLSDLSYDFRFIRRGGAIRGIAFSRVQLTRAVKGARVSVRCSGCRKRGRAVRPFSFTATRTGTVPVSRLNGVQLRRGNTLTVVVTVAERLGRRIVVTMGSRRDVVKLRCLAVGSTSQPVPCSTGT